MHDETDLTEREGGSTSFEGFTAPSRELASYETDVAIDLPSRDAMSMVFFSPALAPMSTDLIHQIFANQAGADGDAPDPGLTDEVQ